MKYVTQEYTVLIGQNEYNDVIIKPNTPFGAFEGEYVVSSAATISNIETKEREVILNAGDKINGIGTVKKTIKRKTPLDSAKEK